MKKEGPLKGLKVVEMSTVVAGPGTARLMAIFGADVIKVEAPGGDGGRKMGGGYCCTTQPYANPCFDLHNSGKRMICLDLKKPEGKEVFLKLCDDADVFITNVRLSGLAKLGISYEDLSKRNPRIIYAHLNGYGEVGPEASRPGFDNSCFWFRVGPELDWQTPGSEPLNPSFAFGDIATATDLYAGILAAIIGRQNTGKGTYVSSSLYGNGIWCNGENVIHVQPPYNRKLRNDHTHPHDPFANAYKTKDGKYIALFGVNYDLARDRMAEFFGIQDLMSDPRAKNYQTLRESGYAAVLVEKIDSFFIQKTADEWCKILTEGDIAHERLRDFIEVKDDEQAWANGFLEKLTMGDGAEVAMPMPSTTFSEYDKRSYDKPLGPIGEHSVEILKEYGYSEEEVKNLMDSKAVI